MTQDIVQVVFKIHDLPAGITDALMENNGLKLGIVGSIPDLGLWQVRNMLTAEREENEWRVASHLPMSTTFRWTWIVTTFDGRVLCSDPAGNRKTTLSFFSGTLETSWGQIEMRFSSQTSAVKMRIHYHCQPGETMAVVGSSATFGSWNPHRAIRATESKFKSHNWIAQVLLDNTVVRSEWKWVVLDSKSGNVKRWEDGNNRHIESTSDRLQMLETRWNSGSVTKYSTNIVQSSWSVEQNVSDRQMISSAHHHGPDEWLNNANTIDFPFEVSDEEVAMIEAADQETRTRKPRRRRSFIRRLPAMFPFLGLLCDLVDLVY